MLPLNSNVFYWVGALGICNSSQESRPQLTDFFLIVLLMMELKSSGAEAVVLLGNWVRGRVWADPWGCGGVVSVTNNQAMYAYLFGIHTLCFWSCMVNRYVAASLYDSCACTVHCCGCAGCACPRWLCCFVFMMDGWGKSRDIAGATLCVAVVLRSCS